MTVSCKDSAPIPKVPNAGEVLKEADREVQIMHNGLKVEKGGYYGEWMSEIIRILRGHHEPQEEKAFYEILKQIPPNATMLEVGGFWAYYSLWFRKGGSCRRNFIIEPDPQFIEVGKRNFALNGWGASFAQGFMSNQSRSNVPFRCESDGVTRLIDQIGIDDWMLENRVDFLDILHADIQGAEVSLLEGARKALQHGKIRFVFLSTHHHSISRDPLSHQKCLRILEDFGANILAEHSVPESYSGDGLIVAAMLKSDAELPSIELTHNRASTSLFRELEYDFADLIAQHQAIRSSRVWKIASPLRRVVGRVNQVLGRV
jgi:FkbM family methyltransferase